MGNEGWCSSCLGAGDSSPGRPGSGFRAAWPPISRVLVAQPSGASLRTWPVGRRWLAGWPTTWGADGQDSSGTSLSSQVGLQPPRASPLPGLGIVLAIDLGPLRPQALGCWWPAECPSALGHEAGVGAPAPGRASGRQLHSGWPVSWGVGSPSLRAPSSVPALETGPDFLLRGSQAGPLRGGPASSCPASRSRLRWGSPLLRRVPTRLPVSSRVQQQVIEGLGVEEARRCGL